MYDIRILEDASRELARLDKGVGRRIVERVNWLAANLDGHSARSIVRGPRRAL